MKTYHGWIVAEVNENSTRVYRCVIDGKTQFTSEGTPTLAIEWWDERTGEKIKLSAGMLNAHRVYTEE